MNSNKKETGHSKNLLISIIIVLIVSIGIFIYAKYMPSSKKIENNLIASNTASITKVGYLDKTDPTYQIIANRVIGDFQESVRKSNPGSPENKLISEKVAAWPQDKRDQLQAIGEKSLNDYAAQIQLDLGTFMLVLGSYLATDDPKKVAAENDIRVQYLGDGKYIAELWEDGLAVNSEANAVSSTNRDATTYPENRDAMKQTYADARKAINDNKQERYNKIMALLYTQGSDGSITFQDPGQPMFDFINQ